MKNGLTIGSYLAALVALVDQMSKISVLKFLQEHPRPFPINDYFNITLSWNKGITFGLLNGYGDLSRYIFIGAAGIILALLVNWLRHVTSLTMTMGLGLVIGGAIGNVIDRVRFGAVVDFLDFHINNHHWYTFNVGDSAIVCGVILLILEHLVRGRKTG